MRPNTALAALLATYAAVLFGLLMYEIAIMHQHPSGAPNDWQYAILLLENWLQFGALVFWASYCAINDSSQPAAHLVHLFATCFEIVSAGAAFVIFGFFIRDRTLEYPRLQVPAHAHVFLVVLVVFGSLLLRIGSQRKSQPVLNTIQVVPRMVAS